MKWFLVLYLSGYEDVMVSKESFSSLEECGTYFNEVQNDLKKIKNVKDIRCEEGDIINSLRKNDDNI